MHYEKACFQKDKGKTCSSVLVLDNLNALCPMIDEDAPPNLTETVKMEKFTNMITQWVEDQQVQIIGVGKHFSLVNPQLFDVGVMDNILELKPPTKE